MILEDLFAVLFGAFLGAILGVIVGYFAGNLWVWILVMAIVLGVGTFALVYINTRDVERI